MRALAAVLLLVAGAAHAESPARDAPRSYGNLRIGSSTANLSERPELCLELAPHRRISVEGCGSGTGFLHRDPDPALSHFRAELAVAGWRLDAWLVRVQAGLGFAELQVGADAPGFSFGGARGDRTSTSGPELSAAVQGRFPLSGRWDLVIELGVAAAWFSHAGELALPQARFQPSAGFSAGVGF
jgi:hypothetical protein